MALTKCDFCTNPNNQRVKSGEVQPWSDYGCSADNCGEALQLMMEYTRLTCAPHSKEITVNKTILIMVRENKSVILFENRFQTLDKSILI